MYRISNFPKTSNCVFTEICARSFHANIWANLCCFLWHCLFNFRLQLFAYQTSRIHEIKRSRACMLNRKKLSLLKEIWLRRSFHLFSRFFAQHRFIVECSISTRSKTFSFKLNFHNLHGIIWGCKIVTAPLLFVC